MNEPVPPNTPFQVTLEAQQWNAVIGYLGEIKYNTIAPLIQAIGQQLQQQPAPTPNGKDRDIYTSVPA